MKLWIKLYDKKKYVRESAQNYGYLSNMYY